MKSGRTILVLFMVLVPTLSWASEWHAGADAFSQARKNQKGQMELPSNLYLGVRGNSTDNLFSGEYQSRLFYDLNRKGDDFDLYQTVFHFRPVERIQIDTGRQFLVAGFSAEILDGLQTVFAPAPHWEVRAWSGIPRTLERGDFNKNDGLLTGLAIQTKSLRNTHAALHTAWRKNNLNRMDPIQNDEVRVGANFSHLFPVTMTPKIYGLAEYDATSRLVETGIVGFDLYPSRRLNFNLEAHHYDVSRKMNRRTIQALFSQGRTWGGQFSGKFVLVRGWADLITRYTFNTVKISAGRNRNAHLMDVATPITIETIGMLLEPGYYFMDSFGGSLHGARLQIHEQFTVKLFANAGVDFAKYKKITKDNDAALSTSAWVGIALPKGFQLALGAEFNKNNLQNKDIRTTLQLGYRFDHEG